MPKRKRSGYGKSDTSKRPAKRFRRTGGTLSVGGRSFVQRNYGNPMAYSETKYFDTERANTNIASVFSSNWSTSACDPATINTLFAPTPGTGYNNREGRKCWVKALKIRGFIRWGNAANLTAGETGDLARIILVQDKQTNGTQLTGDLVIESGTASTDPVISDFQNPNNFGRFKVLSDKVYRRPPLPIAYDGTNMEASGATTPFKIFKKFRRPVMVHFNEKTTGHVDDIVDNSWHILAADWAGDQANAVYYKCRVVYCE